MDRSDVENHLSSGYVDEVMDIYGEEHAASIRLTA